MVGAWVANLSRPDSFIENCIRRHKDRHGRCVSTKPHLHQKKDAGGWVRGVCVILSALMCNIIRAAAR